MTQSALISELESRQQPEGAWPYTAGGPGCTEPTAWALLALRHAGGRTPAVRRGEDWLRKHQRRDGGWAPRTEVDISTWVTSLGLLVFPENPAARAWLMTQTGRESRWTERLRDWMRGVQREYESHEAWSWFPETSSWVAPTAYAILALRQTGTPEVQSRIDEGRRFLWSRRCADGGWNHGGARALGYDADSYPETTGLVLTALAGDRSYDAAAAVAKRHLAACRTAEGTSWLQLGLTAGGQPAGLPGESRCRTIPDFALRLLAGEALDGKHPFPVAARKEGAQ